MTSDGDQMKAPERRVADSPSQSRLRSAMAFLRLALVDFALGIKLRFLFGLVFGIVLMVAGATMGDAWVIGFGAALSAFSVAMLALDRRLSRSQPKRRKDERMIMGAHRDDVDDLVASIALGYDVESDDPNLAYERPPEDEVRWLAEWLVSEGWSRTKGPSKV